MYRILLFGLLLLSIACGKTTAPTPAVPANLDGFEMVNIPGTSGAKAVKKDASGIIIEEGPIVNGLKEGAWVAYHPDNSRIKSITTYVGGKKNGLHATLNNRGQVELQCNYTDDQLDGKWATYKFGTRQEKEINYSMGKYDGWYKEYHSNGKLQKEVSYKNGAQDGPFRQYNDEEKLIMEYEYKNGEKVSGGVVTE